MFESIEELINEVNNSLQNGVNNSFQNREMKKEGNLSKSHQNEADGQYSEIIFNTIISREMKNTTESRDEIIQRLQRSLDVMKHSLESGIKIDVVLPIREAMEQSKKMLAAPYFLSKEIKEAIYWAMSIAEYNSGMGLICAAPTAGSSGVLPAVLFKASDMLYESGKDENNPNVGKGGKGKIGDNAESRIKNDMELKALAIGAAIGVICANRATVSGSEGGCQAEVGIASAMAAASITYMAGGNIYQISEAVAISLTNLLGLICDPVAGLVISPCIKRNTIGVMNAFLAAEMALSGVTSLIPADQVIDALKKVGKMLPSELKETGQGGIAATPKAKLIKKSLFNL